MSVGYSFIIGAYEDDFIAVWENSRGPNSYLVNRQLFRFGPHIHILFHKPYLLLQTADIISFRLRSPMNT